MRDVEPRYRSIIVAQNMLTPTTKAVSPWCTARAIKKGVPISAAVSPNSMTNGVGSFFPARLIPLESGKYLLHTPSYRNVFDCLHLIMSF